MNKRAVLFFATGMVMMLFGISMVVVGTINNYLAVEFNADKVFIGMCASVLAAGILAGSFLFGPLADRFGYKPVMLAGIVLVGGGLAAIIFTGNQGLVPTLFFLIGWGGGMLNGVTNMVVAGIYPEKSSAYLSLLGVFYGVGALGLPLATSLMLARGFSYVQILTVVALVLLIPFVWVLLLKFPPATREKTIPAKEYFRFFTRQGIIILGLFLFFQSALEAVIPVWTPTYLAEMFAVDYTKGLYAITVCAAGITVARLVLGRVLQKSAPVAVVAVSLVVVLAGVLLLSFSPSFYTGLAGIGLMGVGMAASFPVMLGFASGLYPGNPGTALSIVLGIALIGNILLNALTGYVLNLFGTGRLVVLLIVFIVILFVLLRIIQIKLLKRNNYVG